MPYQNRRPEKSWYPSLREDVVKAKPPAMDAMDTWSLFLLVVAVVSFLFGGEGCCILFVGGEGGVSFFVCVMCSCFFWREVSF